MSAQLALALPTPAASNTVVINARCSLRIEAEQRVDRRRRIAGASLSRRGCGRRGLCDGVSGGVGLCPANRSGAGVWPIGAHRARHQGRYAQGGMAALGREEGWRRGRRRISGKRLRSIEMLKSQGMSNRAIAHRLGVSEKAIRKQVGPSKPAEARSLHLPGRRAQRQRQRQRCTACSVDGRCRGLRHGSAKDDAGDGDPIGVPADDGEPVPMSLDRDASDRTFDRHARLSGAARRCRAAVPRRGLRFPVPASCWHCRA